MSLEGVHDVSTNKLRNPEIYRRASELSVLEGFSRVFDNNTRLRTWKAPPAANAANVDQSFRNMASTYGSIPKWPSPADADQDEHAAADRLFYGTERSTEPADAFLSHVWDAPRWQKALTLLYAANVRDAVCAAVVAWLAAVVGLVALRDRDLVSLGGVELTLPVVYAPVAVFLLVLFFGHRRPGRVGRTLWLDKLCIHQTRADLKLAGVASVPDFVRNSRRMTILWNSTYFERLWCVFEVATRVATEDGTTAGLVDFEPLWKAPWVLSMVLVDVVCISVSMKFMFLIPAATMAVQDVLGDADPPLVNLLGAVLGVGSAFALGYVPALMPNYLSLRFKIAGHEQMVAQTSKFSLADTKVTVEGDREVVYGHIVRLFRRRDCQEEPPAAAVRRFEEYVRGDFLAAMTGRLGAVTHIGYGQSMLAVLPLVFSSASDILGCDGGPCAESAAGLGFVHPRVYVAGNIASWTVGCLLVYPTTYPVMLRGMCWCRGRRWERTGCALVVVGSYLYMGLVEGAVMGLVTNAATTDDVGWTISLALFVVLLVLWNLFLFRKH